jgi:hypothetical protein
MYMPLSRMRLVYRPTIITTGSQLLFKAINHKPRLTLQMLPNQVYGIEQNTLTLTLPLIRHPALTQVHRFVIKTLVTLA